MTVAILVGAAVAVVAVCCVGVVAAPTPLDRLHYASGAASLPPLLLAAAVLVEEGWTQPGINALVVGGSLVFLNAVLTHATARVVRRRGR